MPEPQQSEFQKRLEEKRKQWNTQRPGVTLGELAKNDPDAAARLFAKNIEAIPMDEIPDVSWGDVAKAFNPLGVPVEGGLGFIPESVLWSSLAKHGVDTIAGIPELPGVFKSLSEELFKVTQSEELSQAAKGRKAARERAPTDPLTRGAVTLMHKAMNVIDFAKGDVDIENLEEMPNFAEEYPLLNAIMQEYKQKYGSLKGFKYTLATDPFAVLIDVAEIFVPVLKGAKGATIPAKIARGTGKTLEVLNPDEWIGFGFSKGFEKLSDYMKKHPGALGDVEMDFGVDPNTGERLTFTVNLEDLAKEYGGVENVPITALITEDLPKHIEEAVLNLYDSKHPYHQAVVQRYAKTAEAIEKKRRELVAGTGAVEGVWNPDVAGQNAIEDYLDWQSGNKTELGKAFAENDEILEQPVHSITQSKTPKQKITLEDALAYENDNPFGGSGPNKFDLGNKKTPYYEKNPNPTRTQLYESSITGKFKRVEIENTGGLMKRLDEDDEINALIELIMSPNSFTGSSGLTPTMGTMNRRMWFTEEGWREYGEPIVDLLKSRKVDYEIFEKDIIDSFDYLDRHQIAERTDVLDTSEAPLKIGTREILPAEARLYFPKAIEKMEEIIRQDSSTGDVLSNKQNAKIIDDLTELIQNVLADPSQLTLRKIDEMRTDFHQNRDLFARQGEITATGEGTAAQPLYYAVADDFIDLLEKKIDANPQKFPDRFKDKLLHTRTQYALMQELEKTEAAKLIRRYENNPTRLMDSILSPSSNMTVVEIENMKKILGVDGWERLRSGLLARIFTKSMQLNADMGAKGLLVTLNAINKGSKNRLITLFGEEMAKTLYASANFQNRVFDKRGKWNTPYINALMQGDSFGEMIFAAGFLSQEFVEEAQKLADATGLGRHVSGSKLGILIGLTVWLGKKRVRRAMFSEKGRRAVTSLEGRSFRISGLDVEVTAREIALISEWLEKHGNKLGYLSRVSGRVERKRETRQRIAAAAPGTTLQFNVE